MSDEKFIIVRLFSGEAREGISTRLRKEVTGCVQIVVGNEKFWIIFRRCTREIV